VGGFGGGGLLGGGRRGGGGLYRLPHAVDRPGPGPAGHQARPGQRPLGELEQFAHRRLGPHRRGVLVLRPADQRRPAALRARRPGAAQLRRRRRRLHRPRDRQPALEPVDHRQGGGQAVGRRACRGAGRRAQQQLAAGGPRRLRRRLCLGLAAEPERLWPRAQLPDHQRLDQHPRRAPDQRALQRVQGRSRRVANWPRL